VLLRLFLRRHTMHEPRHLTDVTEISENMIAFVARMPLLVKHWRRCEGAERILPKATKRLTNVTMPTKLDWEDAGDALRYARNNCASYEKGRRPR
jgi:hypothetical protein